MAPNSKQIDLTITDRTGIVFTGPVRGLSAYNAKGIFDVLPIHSNFITVLRKKLILHKNDGSKQEMNIQNGVMRVLLGKVEVYLGV